MKTQLVTYSIIFLFGFCLAIGILFFYNNNTPESPVLAISDLDDDIHVKDAKTYGNTGRKEDVLLTSTGCYSAFGKEEFGIYNDGEERYNDLYEKYKSGNFTDTEKQTKGYYNIIVDGKCDEVGDQQEVKDFCVQLKEENIDNESVKEVIAISKQYEASGDCPTGYDGKKYVIAMLKYGIFCDNFDSLSEKELAYYYYSTNKDYFLKKVDSLYSEYICSQYK